MSSSPSSSVVAARKALANRLTELRKDAGLKGEELSARCGWHPAKTSRLQNGKAAPSEDDLRAWCRACGAEGRIPDLIAAARAVDSLYTEWRRMERTGLRAAQESVFDLYERTRHFRVYASKVVPGMVQTREYTAAVLRAIQRSRVAIDDVEAAVEARMERQRMLFSGPRRFALVLEESVLRGAVCDGDTLAGQLGHLIAVSTSPSISLGIIPTRPDRARSPAEDFYMFDDALVSVELTVGHLRHTEPREVRDYAAAFLALSQMAVYGGEARALLTSAIDALR
ncbi:helix-turn-helix transcriptional regulator [Kitasatospora sp. NPDC002965]|uniref:helix-turn-helix domain-containing protein n=1 Tax=Kitasatospora sp. NPDC002965 TaxID=3154775 RepID=UPI0033A620BF